MDNQTEPNPVSLGEALPLEQQRVAALIKEYEGLPGNAGFLGALMMRSALHRSNIAAMSGDVLEMIRSYEIFKEFE